MDGKSSMLLGSTVLVMQIVNLIIICLYLYPVSISLHRVNTCAHKFCGIHAILVSYFFENKKYPHVCITSYSRPVFGSVLHKNREVIQGNGNEILIVRWLNSLTRSMINTIRLDLHVLCI